jgi:hypothetical protein
MQIGGEDVENLLLNMMLEKKTIENTQIWIKHNSMPLSMEMD